MTRRTPGMIRSQSSLLSLHQMSAALKTTEATPEPQNSMEAKLQPFSDSSKDAPERSDDTREFVLAGMEERDLKENFACSQCAAKLSLQERVKVHPSKPYDVPCQLCQIADQDPEAYTKPFTDFLRDNPTVWHTVEYFKNKLGRLGFTELPPRDAWENTIQPGGKYWVTRNGSSIIAFTVGKAYKPGNGVGIVAGHIDAITARLKPVSQKPNKAGYIQLGVAPYAGGLNRTWWDRDLGIGGRVIIRDEETGRTSSRLVKLDWPIAKVPTLAPHFGVGMMGKNNAETEAVPIIGLENTKRKSSNSEPLGPAGSFVNTQPRRLVELIAKELGVTSYSSILNWDLELFDTQPAQTLGLDREFITAGRIDDKLCSWPAIIALLGSENDENDGYIKLVSLFDNEEIGSLLRQGARGNFLPQTIERIVEALNPNSSGPGLLGQTYAKSFLVSADVTHAGNPNFLQDYLEEHIPQLNVGMAITADANGHMTTDAVSTAIMRRVAELSDSQTQVFQIRNDSRSGGTVGPMLSSALGVRAADVGLPQLSMHSVRATTGALDPGLGVKFFKGFFDNWEKIDNEWEY